MDKTGPTRIGEMTGPGVPEQKRYKTTPRQKEPKKRSCYSCENTKGGHSMRVNQRPQRIYLNPSSGSEIFLDPISVKNVFSPA